MKIIRYPLFAVLALSGLLILPGTASATIPGLSSLGYPESLHFSGGEFNLESAAYCDAPDLDATINGPTYSLTATAEGSTNNCISFNMKTLDMKDCTLILHGWKADIGPSGCGPAQVGICRVSATNGLDATYTGTPVVTVVGLRVTQTVEISGSVNTTSCGRLTLNADWTIDSGTLYTGDYAFDGIALTREASPQLEAFAYPVQQIGFATGTVKLLDGIAGEDIPLECTQAYLNQGGISYRKEAPYIGLTGTYSGFPGNPSETRCSLAGFPTTVSMNSCGYELNGIEWQSEGDFVSDKAVIVCDYGDGITLSTPDLLCTIKILPQSLEASLHSQELSGISGISVEVGGDALKWTASGYGCTGALGKTSGDDAVMHQQFLLGGALS